jgi:predicted transcriptional regulator
MTFTENEQKIILELKNMDGFILSRIAKTINITGCCTMQIINRLEKYNLLKSERVGRKRIIRVTEKGLKVSQIMNQINNLLKS